MAGGLRGGGDVCVLCAVCCVFLCARIADRRNHAHIQMGQKQGKEKGKEGGPETIRREILCTSAVPNKRIFFCS